MTATTGFRGASLLRRRARRVLRLTAVLTALAVFPAAAAERLNMADFCATPPFLNVKGERPNIMLFVDNSASMVYAAHSAAREFDPYFDFYGYFDSKACYDYDAGLQRFKRSAILPTIGGYCPQWSGNYLNWAFISRFEAIKKAMAGGRYDPVTKLLSGENVSEVGNPKNKSNYCITTATVNNPKTYNGALGAIAFGTSFQLERRSQVATIASKCSGGGIVKTNIRFVIDMSAEPEPTGVVHTLGAYSARWGFASFKPGAFKDAARVFVPYGYDPVLEPNPSLNMVNIIRTLDSEPTSGSSGEDDSPLAEAYFELVKYHAQVAPTHAINYQRNDVWDPWKEWERPGLAVGDPIPAVPCRQSNIVFLSDGRPSNDGDGIGNWDGVLDLREAGGVNQAVRPWPPATRPLYNPNPENDANIVDGLRLDDAAHCGRRGGAPCGLGAGGDLRTDIDSRQWLDGYFIYAFGNNYGPRNVQQERGLPYMMYWAGAAGIFTDLGNPGNGRVDGIVTRNNSGVITAVLEPSNPKEWDEDGDGEPDGFFDAANGEEIERAVRKAIERIIKRTSAGTSVAVLSQSGEGEASLFQAYFHPEFFDGTTSATWVGFLRGLWLDKFGNIRQDSTGPGMSEAELKPDQHLILTDDKIMKYRFDGEQNETFVDLYVDPDKLGVTSPTNYAGTVKISQLTSLFEAGERLHRRPPWTRMIYTADAHDSNVRALFPTADWHSDTDGDGISDFSDMSVVPPAGGWWSESKMALGYHLGYADNQDTSLYLTHPFLQGWRSRELLVTDTSCGSCGEFTWKLGDIIYSTPVAVGAPSTRYDQIYGGKANGYAEFFTTHTARPQVVYVGANDGQLRAFYVGTFRNGASPTRPDADAWFDPKCDPKYGPQCVTGVPSGTELWSWIPRNTFPSLKFLTRGDYCHTYYVDGEPFVTDAQVFNPADPMYPQGWGSLLVVTARLGCRTATTPAGTFRPFVLILDVTNPFDPKPFAEYTSPQLGFATVQPTIMRGDTGDWFLVFASGPGDYNFTTAYNGVANQAANLHVLRLDGGGARTYTPFVIPLPAVAGGHLGEFATRPIAIDLENDFDVDTLYLPTTIARTAGNYDGRVLRITTRASSDDVGKVNPDPTKWKITEFFRTDGAISSSPRFAVDDTGKPWIYFGSGRYLNVDDPGDMETQFFYGVRDDMACMQDPYTATCPVLNIGDVVEIDGCILKADGSGFEGACSTSSGDDSSAADICTEVLSVKKGWAIKLRKPGERSISRSLVNRRTVIFSTFLPGAGAICGGGGGSSRVYFADYRCGITYAIKDSTSTGGSNIISLGSSVAVADTVGQIELIDNVADFDELSGVQMYMTPYLEQ